ncbi:MAG: PAS domain S-box protein [Syntrophales bacterium]
MDKPLRILILEDSPADAELIQFEMEDAGLTFTAKVVMTEEDFIHELQTFAPDIILSDYDLPRYTGSLALAEAKRRCPDVPCKIDFATGRFTEVNEMMCHALGYAHDKFFSMTIFDLLDEEGKVRLAALIHRAKSGGQLDETAEYRVRTKRGRLIWALVNITFRWEGDRIVEAAVVAHDITARKKAEEAMRRDKPPG